MKDNLRITIVRNKDMGEFEFDLNRHLSQGWKLRGVTNIIKTKSGESLLVQQLTYLIIDGDDLPETVTELM